MGVVVIQKSPRSISLLVVVIASSLALWVSAQGPGTSNALLPYQGRLDENGVPVNGDADLRVAFFTSPGASTACLEGANLVGCGVWNSQFNAVPVSDGRFTLSLGSTTALPDSTFQQDALFIGVAVRRGTDPFVALSGVQRLAAVPYAVRAERSNSLVVADSIGVGTSAPIEAVHIDYGQLRVRSSTNDIATPIGAFLAENQTQGVGIVYNGLRAIGTNGDQDLVLEPKGFGGRVKHSAVKNNNGTLSRYAVDADRYLVEVPIQFNVGEGYSRGFTSIPDDVMQSMCGDEDGCTTRIGMKNWLGPSGSVTSRTMTSMGPIHFHVGETFGGQRAWRRSTQPLTNDNAGGQDDYNQQGLDNGSGVEHVLRDHDCYFTDAVYPAGTNTSSDTALGFGVLNWRNVGSTYTPTCVFIIDD
jgi:hypothetical protein